MMFARLEVQTAFLCTKTQLGGVQSASVTTVSNQLLGRDASSPKMSRKQRWTQGSISMAWPGLEALISCQMDTSLSAWLL